MALVVKDRVRVTTASTGTGLITLGIAVNAFQDFSVIGDGNTTYYTIVDSTAGDWEVGIGTYTASGTTLSRDTILESSNSGSVVNFGVGIKDVFVTYPAEKAVYFDAADAVNIDNLKFDGNTISSTNTDGNIDLTPNGTGEVNITKVDIAGGEIDGTTIGANSAAAGTFTTATATTGNITTVNSTTTNATTVDTTNIEVTNLKAKDGTAAGSIADSTGIVTITSLSSTTGDITTVNATTVDTTNIEVTNVKAKDGTASATIADTTGYWSFSGTGAFVTPKGNNTTERPGTPVSGMLRYNTTINEFEGYNGTAWASVGGSAISNDTTTATDLYPTFVDATTGTALELFTSNAQYLFKPSTGELKVKAPVASNGILVNATTMTSNYTIATGTNGLSVGPFTIDSGVTLTINSGQRHLIL